MRVLRSSLVILGLLSGAASAADPWGLKTGAVDLKSAGSLAFGPDGVLLVADPLAATVYALDTGDAKKAESSGIRSDDFAAAAAAALNVKPGDVEVKDLAANRLSGSVYASVNADGKAAIVRVTPGGKVEKLDLAKIPHAMVQLPDAPEDKVVEQRGRKRNADRIDHRSRVYRRQGPGQRRHVGGEPVQRARDSLPVHHGRRRDERGNLSRCARSLGK
ncbi:MAG: hypothetical protein QM811_14770 [Pirellulales bacterium]